MWENYIRTRRPLSCEALLSSFSNKNNFSHQTAHWPPVLQQICTHSSNQCIPLPFTEISSSREQHRPAQQRTRHDCWRLHNGSASKHTSLKALGTNKASSRGTPWVAAAAFFYFILLMRFFRILFLGCYTSMFPYLKSLPNCKSLISLVLVEEKRFWICFSSLDSSVHVSYVTDTLKEVPYLERNGTTGLA